MAPASRACSMSSRWLNAVSMTTGAIRSSTIVAAAVMPSTFGIFTSMITRSGRSARASSTRLLAVAGLTGDDVALLGEHLGEVEPDQRLVLDDEHPQSGGGGRRRPRGRSPETCWLTELLLMPGGRT